MHLLNSEIRQVVHRNLKLRMVLTLCVDFSPILQAFPHNQNRIQTNSHHLDEVDDHSTDADLVISLHAHTVGTTG